MVQTKDFIYLGMFRSGTTFINNLLKNKLDGELLGYHRPNSLMPNKSKDLKMLATIRNPFDWYVSVYYHALNYSYPMKTPTFLNFVLRYKKKEFKDAIKHLLTMCPSDTNKEEKEEMLKRFPYHYNLFKPFIDNLRKTEFESYFKSGVGYYTWWIDYIYQREDTFKDIHFIETKNLNKGLIKYLGQFEDLPHDEIKHYIKNTEKENATCCENKLLVDAKKHKRSKGKHELVKDTTEAVRGIIELRDEDYKKYYDQELIDLILEKDKKYIDHFKFTF
jgi:hypothetical protein